MAAQLEDLLTGVHQAPGMLQVAVKAACGLCFDRHLRSSPYKATVDSVPCEPWGLPAVHSDGEGRKLSLWILCGARAMPAEIPQFGNSRLNALRIRLEASIYYTALHPVPQGW